jgi:AraC family transcriptional regulator
MAMQTGEAVRKDLTRVLAPWQIHRAIRLLLSADGANCSVEMLACACGLSRSHFAHAFKASTGVPPHRWLLLHRVQRAREMMEGTSESLSAIAVSCGFADQSHFTRAFGSIVGASPAAWRRERRSGVTTAELELSGAAGGFDMTRSGDAAGRLWYRSQPRR